MEAMFNIGVHALVYLHHKQENVSSEALAENICTNPARVRKVMARLKKAGMVETKEGITGGYRFIGEAATLSLDRIAAALEVTFVETGWRSGDTDMDCLVASGMADIMDEIYGTLNTLCYEKLKNITIADIDQRIFSGKDARKKAQEGSSI